MSKDEALALIKTEWWVGRTDDEIARWQLNEERLCMPFDLFQKAVEGVLGRPVWTHEFADPNHLRAELDGDEPTPADPAQHAIDSLAALLLSMGKDPDKQMIVVTGRDSDE